MKGNNLNLGSGVDGNLDSQEQTPNKIEEIQTPEEKLLKLENKAEEIESLMEEANLSPAEKEEYNSTLQQLYEEIRVLRASIEAETQEFAADLDEMLDDLEDDFLA